MGREYLLVWQEVLLPMCREFKPDIVLISAGFDACIGDPLGGMRVTPPCYGLLTRLLLNECESVGVILEGGYNLETMPRAICCVNYALMKGPQQQKDAFDVDEFEREYLQFVEENGGNKDFDEWKGKYGKLLDDEQNETGKGSVFDDCKKTIKQVLVQQQKYWKFASEILQKYK